MYINLNILFIYLIYLIHKKRKLLFISLKANPHKIQQFGLLVLKQELYL